MPTFQIVIAVGQHNMRPVIPPGVSPTLATLITQCWSEDPALRCVTRPPPAISLLLLLLFSSYLTDLPFRTLSIGWRRCNLPTYTHPSSTQHCCACTLPPSLPPLLPPPPFLPLRGNQSRTRSYHQSNAITTTLFELQ